MNEDRKPPRNAGPDLIAEFCKVTGYLPRRPARILRPAPKRLAKIVPHPRRSSLVRPRD